MRRKSKAPSRIRPKARETGGRGQAKRAGDNCTVFGQGESKVAFVREAGGGGGGGAKKKKIAGPQFVFTRKR